MTHDLFEDELRAQLHGAVDHESHAYMDIDPTTVLFTGHRVVRRRRAAAGAGIAAAVLVTGIVGWSAIGTGVDRASLPAGTSRTSSSPSVAGTAVTARLDPFSDLSGTDGRPLAVPGPRQVAVTVDPTRTPDLVYSEVGAGGALTMMGGSSLEGIAPSASTWGTAGEGSHVLVGVLPADAVQFQLVTPMDDKGGHAATSVTAPLPGTGRQAFAVRFAEAADADAVRHLLWWGGDGVVHDETGATVPSVALGDPEGTVVFVSDSLDRMGTFSDGDGLSSMTLDGSRNSSGRPVLAAGRGDADRIEWLFAAVVPASAQPGTITPTAGTTIRTPLTRAPVAGTQLAVLWSRFSSPRGAEGSGYAAVTWTEDGRTVTQRP
jgi:hypothetical protein